MNSASELPEDHSKHNHDSGKLQNKPSKAYSIEEYLDSLVIEKLKRIEAVILENSQLYPAITNLQYTRDLKYLNLSKNATSPYIGNIQMIPYLGKLVKLDISENGIIKLPKRDFFLKFPQLRILYLHGNALPDETFVPSVSGLKSLVYITIFNNPLDKNAARKRLIQLLPKLQGIDFLAVLDWEKSTEVAAPMLEFQIEKAEIKWPVCPVQNSTEETAIMTGVYEEIRTIQVIYARANSIVKIQKFIKSCLLRRKFAVSFLKGYRVKKELILKIYKRWKERARLQVVMRNILKERGKLELFYSGYRRRARNVQVLVKKFAQKLLDHLTFIKNVVRLQRILKKYYGKLFALYKEPLKLFSLENSLCFYILYTHKNQTLKIISTALSRKPQVLGKVRPEEVMEQITESIAVSHDIRAIRYQTDVNVKVLPLYQLIRPIMKGIFRVCKPALKGDYFIKNANKINIRMKTRSTLSTQEKSKFRTRKDERDFYFEENYGQLVKISIPDLNILQYILKVILSHNMNCESPDDAVLVYFDNGIDRVSAATTIQTCYRRYKLLKHSPYRNIFNNIKTLRAIILLQRWIRTSKFRCRMAFLSNVRYYINKIGSRSLYIEEDVYAGLCDLVEANLQRMHLIDQRVKIYLNPQTNEVLVLRNTPRGLPNRPFLPYWIDQIKHPTVERFTTFTEGDIINLLHAGTKISRKVKEDVKYFKIRYPKLENAKYVAAAIALMTFTMKNAGFFIKLIDKKRFKTQLEKHRVYYHSQITKSFGINIEKTTDPQAVEAHLAKKRRAFLNKHHANCCFIFTPDQQEFKALAEEAAKEHVYEVKVYCQEGLGQPSYLTKTSKHVLKDYSRVPISVFFIPFTYFAKIAKKGMSEDLFYMFKKMIRDKTSNKVEEFQLLKNTIKKPSQSIERDPGSDLRQLFIQEMSLRKTFHKTKEIVTMRKEFNENKEKYEETKREGLELARHRTSEQRKETQQKKYMIDVTRGAAVQQKIKEGQKLKEEISLKVKQIAEIASLNKKENVREMQHKARARLSASAAKDSSRVFSAIGMLMSEEGRDEYKKIRENHLSGVKTKVTQIKEKRLEDKAFHVILQELKKPKQDSFLADYDKNLVEQSVSMSVNKIDMSFQSEADKSKTFSKPTHLRFRKLLERHSAQNEPDVQDDTMGDDSRIITENYQTKSTEKQRGVEDSPYSAATLNVLNVSGSKRARSVLATPGDRLSLPQSSFEMKKGGFRPRLPSLNGRLLEEYYPIARKNEPDMFGL